MSQQNFNFSIPTEIIYGINSVKHKLPDTIRSLQKAKVFVATDPGLLNTGIIDAVTSLLNMNDIDTVVFSDVEPNPHAQTVMKGAQIYKQESCEMILAIGGGSPMDFGKAVSAIVTHEGHILDYRRGQKPLHEDIPILIAIPTTVGTGSEVTPVSVITDHEAGRKYVIASPMLAPKAAFIDPSLTTSLPRHVVSATGVDALVHAIESYTSLKSNPITDGLAFEAIKMIKGNLPASYAHPDNLEARAKIHLASTMAGISFGMAGVALVHSCSHPMSALYQVPHGLANAILLPHIIEHNLIANYEKYANIARVFEPSLTFENDRNAARKLAPLLKEFNKALDIPGDFSFLKLEFTDEMVDRLSKDAMNDLGTIPNNPRKAEKEDICKIYKKVLPMALIKTELEAVGETV
ncbi:iron-containing alcohol dehydrogenase family protein [Cytobacillus oceanisediminis]|uniref:iron-containing alcohol dehydrogenase family protein n=1 Tax=Cytobacillus oceanisediminis TaxID=665099 RepID=UPI0023DB204A|nr:iron-containing alcohol dehydrogenase family protein [Cytobacillus oceanisediminis]MDF2037739.1 iron-containing alcohol dehydrogenase family protein [Cytobacillus oceanisediminis]